MLKISLKSSSFHTINCDYGLNNPIKKIVWHLLNYLNNYNYFSKGKFSYLPAKFTCDLNKNWESINILSSPSRRLSELFWINVPWNIMKEELGEIRILDIGCGTGLLGEKIQRLLTFQNYSYTGIDIQPYHTWSIYAKKFGYNFSISSAENISPAIFGDANLIISQSSLEHVEYDIQFFERLDRIIRTKSNNTIQIHLLPSEACLHLYGCHGVRQYSIRTLNKICNLFSEYSSCMIYSLGGELCNSIHYSYITRPGQLGHPNYREEKPDEYNQALKSAMHDDFISENLKPNFYALIIHSFPGKKIRME